MPINAARSPRVAVDRVGIERNSGGKRARSARSRSAASRASTSGVSLDRLSGIVGASGAVVIALRLEEFSERHLRGAIARIGLRGLLEVRPGLIEGAGLRSIMASSRSSSGLSGDAVRACVYASARLPVPAGGGGGTGVRYRFVDSAETQRLDACRKMQRRVCALRRFERADGLGGPSLLDQRQALPHQRRR